MHTNVEILPATQRLSDLRKPPASVSIAIIVSGEGGELTGIVTAASLARTAEPELSAVLSDIVESNYVIVSPDDSLSDVVAAISASNSIFALVAPKNGNHLASDILGVISCKDIVDTLATGMELF